jgi:predicted TIM-barrel fold metal-dependent hydrolase
MTQLDTERPMKVIDADSHMSERWDLWTRSAPAHLKDRMPYVTVVDGAPSWVVEGNVIHSARGGCVIDKDDQKVTLVDVYEGTTAIDDYHPAAYDPVARLEVLDKVGIAAQVVFPNAVGIGGDKLSTAVPDEAHRLLLLQMFNDYNAEVQSEANNRLLPLAVMPAWDVDACAAEAERAASLGLRGVNMTSDPQDQGAPDLANRAWDSLWEVCSAYHLPVHFHIATSATAMAYFGTYPWESHDDYTKFAIGGTLLFVGNAKVVVNILCSAMLERHPDLKIVSVESGAGWIPFILEALDYEMAENAPEQLAKNFSMLPSEYFRRQIYATTWFERRNIASLVAGIGADNLLFETDFPHPTCLYPDPLKTAAENLAGLAPEDRRKILGENAAALYRV